MRSSEFSVQILVFCTYFAMEVFRYDTPNPGYHLISRLYNLFMPTFCYDVPLGLVFDHASVACRITAAPRVQYNLSFVMRLNREAALSIYSSTVSHGAGAAVTVCCQRGCCS